jgi:hypothetical protein
MKTQAQHNVVAAWAATLCWQHLILQMLLFPVHAIAVKPEKPPGYCIVMPVSSTPIK